MDRDREERLADLEARVARLEARLDGALEGAGFAADDEERPELEGAVPRGAEYWIGAKLLPRFGAVLIVLAIAYVAISESSKNPSLDRTLLIAGQALLCLGFIAFGEWRRDELEGFGLTLSAIGSCGLYLTAAQGHFAYGALTGAGMAIGFALLTLLNHAFAVWRNTRLFFFIGATGGLAAMLFPLAEKDYGTALAVYTAVTVAGAAVCARRRWPALALIGWFLSLVIVVPIIDSEHSRLAVLGAMYAGSLACIAAYARACSGPSFEVPALGAPIALIVTGLMGFWIDSSVSGIVHVLVLAAAGSGIAATLSSEHSCHASLMVGSVAVAAVLVPLCLPPLASTLAYCALSALAYAIGRVAFQRLAAAFATAGLVAAGLRYAAATGDAHRLEEAAMLVALAIALGGATSALRAVRWGWLGLAVGGAWILVIRLAQWTTVTPETGAATYSNATIATLAYALLLLVLGFRLDSAALRMWSFAVMLGSVLQTTVFDSGTAVGFRFASLVTVGILMLVGGYRYVHDQISAMRSESAKDEESE